MNALKELHDELSSNPKSEFCQELQKYGLNKWAMSQAVLNAVTAHKGQAIHFLILARAPDRVITLAERVIHQWENR